MAEGLFGGRIALGEEIGRGAMGVVYKAVLNGSDVAVKVLHPHLTSDLAVVGRFVREHQALSRIDHPNVVRVIELVVDDPRLGIVMEYLHHPDLGQVIASGMDPRRAVRLATGIASGVAAIHDAQVAHRDLKPANVLVAEVIGDDGSVEELPKIADFGVSRLIGQSVASSATTTLGTPLYMSPEATGGSTPIGRPSDVYSLGVILFEMLTGHPPYQAEEPIAIAVAHVNSPVPVLGGVPDQLSELLQAMLAKEAADRPDAATVATTLRALAPHLPVDLQPAVLNEPVVDLRDPDETRPLSIGDGFFRDETVGGNGVPPQGRSSATVLIAESDPGPSAFVDFDSGPRPPSSEGPGSFGFPAPDGAAAREGRSILGYAPPERPGNGAPPPPGPGGGPPVWASPGASYPPDGDRRRLATTTAASVRRGWLPIGLAALALLLIIPIGWVLWGQGRSDSADVEASTTDAAFSFMPHLGANGLITTRRWELGLDAQGRRVINAEVIVANSGAEPVEATHYEAFPETIDADHLVSTFRPEPDEVRPDPGVAIFQIGELAPRARFVLVYNMLAPDSVTSVEELQALAESQLNVEAAFLDSLPDQAAQEAMETDGVLTSLTLSPTRLEVAVGEIATASLTGTLADGTSIDPAALASAIWVVNDPTVAEVTANNSIRGLRTGRTTVTVSVGDIEATISLSVVTPDVAAGTTTTGSSTTSTSTSSSTTEPTTGSTTSSTASTTETTASEATLTMSPLSAQVNADGSFKITFTTNECTIANYQGAGQSYITPGWPEVTGPCWESHGQNFTAVAPGSYQITVQSRTAGGQQAQRTMAVVIEDSGTTTTEPAEPNLTMSPLGVKVNDDGSFRITFTTNLCTIANYQGAGQSYITPGWPEVTGPCWESHGQNFTAVAPGRYEVEVKSRSAGGQQRRRTATVVIPEP